MTNKPQNDECVEVASRRFTFQDIHSVVQAFYREVAKDPMLSVPFSSVSDWPHHIERLTNFWWTRFGGRPYMQVQYNPVQKHFETGFSEQFLERWLELFQATLTKTLDQDQAELWISIAKSMGKALAHNNELMKLRDR